VLAKGAGVALAGRILGRGLSVVVQAVLARGLGPIAYGLYGLGWTVLRMGASLSSFGLSHGVVRYGARHTQGNPSQLRDVLVQSVMLSVLSGAVVGLVLYALAPWLAGEVFSKPDLARVIRWFAPGFAFSAGLQVSASATRISKRIQFAAFSQEIFQPLANLILILVAFLFGWGLAGAVGAAVASFGLAMVLAFLFVLRLFGRAFAAPEKPRSVAGELLTFSAPAALASVFTTFLILVDRLIVGYFRPAAEVGVYQAASTASAFFPVVLTAFSGILAPMIAALHHNGESERLLEVYRVSTKWALYVSLPVFLTILFRSRELMEVIFGKGYVAGGSLLVVLSLGQLINVSTGSINVALLMTGHQNRWLMMSGAALVADITLGVMLAAKYGAMGAAWATAVSVGGLWIFAMLDGRRVLNLWPYDRRILKGAAASLVTFSGMTLVRNAFAGPALITLVVMAILAVLIFFITLFALGIDREDREALIYVRERLKSFS